MARADPTLISFSRVRDHGRQIALSHLGSLIFRFWLHPFLKRSCLLQQAAEAFLNRTIFFGGGAVVRDASLWFLRDLTPIGQQGCLLVARVLFL